MPNESWVARNKDILIVGLILLVAFLFRLYRLDIPLADLHSWRQIESIGIAEAYIQGNLKLDSLLQLSNTAHYVEFSLIHILYASLYTIAPFFSLIEWARLTTIFFSLVSIGLIYIICRRETTRTVAIVASSIYAIFPFFVYFSRVILPETPALAFFLLSIVCLYGFVDQKILWKRVLLVSLAVVTFSLAIVIKPPIIIFSIIAMPLFLRKYKLEIIKGYAMYAYYGLSVLPFIVWLFILNFPVPENTSLFGRIIQPNGESESVFFSLLFVKTVFFDRIGIAMLGIYLLFPFLLGVLIKNRSGVISMLLVASLIYIFVFQGANVQYVYYQTLIMPLIAIGVGLGVQFIFKHEKLFHSRAVLVPVLLVTLALAWYSSYRTVRDYYSYSTELVRIAGVVRTLTTENARIVTDQEGDITLLYLADREGTARYDDSLESLKDQGYTHFLTDKSEQIDSLKQQDTYQVVFENNKFVLFSL